MQTKESLAIYVKQIKKIINHFTKAENDHEHYYKKKKQSKQIH